MRLFAVVFIFLIAAMLAILALAEMKVEPPVKFDAKEYGFSLIGERVFYQWYTEDQCTKARSYLKAQGAEMFCMPIPWKSKVTDHLEQHKH